MDKNSLLVFAVLLVFVPYMMHTVNAASGVPFDQGQTIHVNDYAQGGVPPYTYKWLVETPSSSNFVLSPTSICEVPSGQQPAPNVTETCTFVTNTLTQVGEYQFIYQATDSASNPQTTNSAIAQLIVNKDPVATISAASQSIVPGQSDVITTSLVNGTGSFTINTIENGAVVQTNTLVPINGHASFVFIPTSTGNYVFQANVVDAGTVVPFTFNSTKITVNAGSSFTSANVLVLVSKNPIDIPQSTVFSVQLNGGSSPFTYAWTFKGNTIGTNSNTLTFNANSSTLGSDQLKVTVTDKYGQQGTGSNTVTVNRALNNSDVTVAVPNSVINEGQSESITANVVGGSTPYSYSWTLNGKTLGQTTQTITFNGNASDLGTDTLQLTVTDGAGQTATGSGTVTVNNAVSFGSPSITIPNSIIDVGQSETVTANVMGGTAPYSFAWTLNGKALGQTTQSITFNGNTSDIGTDNLKVTVTDHNSQTASATGTVTVNNAVTLGSPSVTIPNSIINEGQSESITANVVGGTSPYSYAWKLNGKALGQTTQTITFNGNASDLGTDTVQVTVTDHTGAAATGSGTVTVNNAVSFGSPSITIPNSIIDVGQSETVTANVMGGTAPYSFAWTLNGKTLGQTTQSITFNGNTSDVGTDTLKVTVTDHNSQTASATGTVTVNNAVTLGSPSVTIPNSIINEGQSESITANVIGGTSPYSYAWKLNGKALGQTTQTITFNGNASDLGTDTVQVTVTDHTGATATGSGTVTVNNAVSFGSPSITIPNSMIDVGQSEVIVANVIGGTAPYSFAWTLNGKVLAPTTQSITFNGNTSDVGNDIIMVTVTDHTGATASSTGTVIVNNALIAPTPTPASQIVDQGQTANVMESQPTTGTSPYTYNWMELPPGNSLFIAATDCAVMTTKLCTFATTNSTPTGEYSFLVNVADAAGESAKSVSVQVVVNTALYVTPPTIDPFDVGQTAYINDTIHSSATPPYAYSFLVEYPGSSSFAVANSICPTTASGKNQVANTVETCAFTTNSLTRTGVYKFEFQVTDSATNPNTTTSSPVPMLLNATPVVTLIPSNSALGIGQTETIKAKVSGGVGPFAVNILENGNVVDTLIGIPYNGFGTYTFASSAPGTLTFNAVSTDLGTTNPFVFNSTKLSIPVSSGFSASISPTTFDADIGQPVAFDAVISGGISPFTYSWTFKSKSVGSDSSVLTFNAASSGTVKLLATDSESPVATANAAASLVIVGNALNVSVTPNSVSIANGAQQSFIANVTGGSGSFTYQWYNDTTGSLVAISGATSNMLTITGQAAGTFEYEVAVADTQTTGPYTVTSDAVQLNVAAPVTTGGGSPGGGGGGGGGGGSGGNFVPVVTNTTANGQICAVITNMSQDNGASFLLRNVHFTVTENYITPTTAGVTINSQVYDIKNGSTVSLGSISGNNYTATLRSISYLPILQSISLAICSPNPKVPTQSPIVGLSVNITGNIITAIGPSNDLISILADNAFVASGKGKATYNATNLLPGTYIISAKDSNSDTTVVASGKYTRQKYVPALTFTNKCFNQTYVTGFSCTTTAYITNTNGKLIATLYVNGNVVGSTANSVGSTETAAGTYRYLFSTSGNANFSAESISYTYVIKSESKLEAPKSGLWAYLPELAAALLAAVAAALYLFYKRRRKAIPANITKVDLDQI